MKAINLVKIFTALLFFFAGSVAFGQQTSIKTMPTGNGPLLNGLKIDDVGIGGGHFSNLQNLGIGSMTKAEIVSKKVVVAIRYSGTITEYRYNGKTYKSSYSDGKCTVPSYHTTAVKATAKVQVGSQAHTISGNISQLLAESGNLILNLDKEVPVKDMKLLSVTLEPAPNTFYEKELNSYLTCLNKAKENKEKKKETSKTADDFWNGSEKKSNSKKVTQNEKEDFWSGGNRKSVTMSNSEKSSGEDFWSSGGKKTKESVNNNHKTTIKNEGGLYWVEDENGNILIPKDNYQILDYKDGLAKVEKKVFSLYDEVLEEVSVYQNSYINSKGKSIPPVKYTMSYTGGNHGLVLYSRSMSDDQIKASKQRNRNKMNAAEERVKSKLKAMGYDIEY